MIVRTLDFLDMCRGLPYTADMFQANKNASSVFNRRDCLKAMTLAGAGVFGGAAPPLPWGPFIDPPRVVRPRVTVQAD